MRSLTSVKLFQSRMRDEKVCCERCKRVGRVWNTEEQVVHRCALKNFHHRWASFFLWFSCFLFLLYFRLFYFFLSLSFLHLLFLNGLFGHSFFLSCFHSLPFIFSFFRFSSFSVVHFHCHFFTFFSHFTFTRFLLILFSSISKPFSRSDPFFLFFLFC